MFNTQNGKKLVVKLPTKEMIMDEKLKDILREIIRASNKVNDELIDHTWKSEDLRRAYVYLASCTDELRWYYKNRNGNVETNNRKET